VRPKKNLGYLNVRIEIVTENTTFRCLPLTVNLFATTQRKFVACVCVGPVKTYKCTFKILASSVLHLEIVTRFKSR
jgi:hypothetical protein